MDLDALTAARAPAWDRLDQLSRRSRLTGAEADELAALYQSVSADLAELKTAIGRSPQADRVSLVLAGARVRLTRARQNPFAAIPRFFALQLPAALYAVRWTTLAVAVGTIVVAVAMAAWVSNQPAAIAAIAQQMDLDSYVQHQFVDYYNPAAAFAGTVWTNNAFIALQSVLFGITGVWPIYVMMQNAINIGLAAGVMFASGAGDVFVLYILPHGMLELTSLFVAAAGGLHLFWAWVAPGPRTRAEALAHAGRTLVVVAIGTVLSLLLSGLVEGFVTGQPWPWPVKIGIGALALGVFLFYMLVIGGRATRAGETGDLDEFRTGTPILVDG